MIKINPISGFDVVCTFMSICTLPVRAINYLFEFSYSTIFSFTAVPVLFRSDVRIVDKWREYGATKNPVNSGLVKSGEYLPNQFPPTEAIMPMYFCLIGIVYIKFCFCRWNTCSFD